MKNTNYLKPIALFSFVLIFLASCSVTRNHSGDLSFKNSPPVSKSKRKVSNQENQLRQDIVGYAENFVGTPYNSTGTSPETGFDCSGFVKYVMKEFNVKVSQSSNTQVNDGDQVNVLDAKAGDLVFFQKGGRIFHVALVVSSSANEGLTVVHSTSSVGIIVENVSKSDYWKDKIYLATNVISRQVPNM